MITNSRKNALKLKHRIAKFLRTALKLELSEDKTKITNLRKRPMQFLGFSLKLVKGKSKSGFVTRTSPLKNKAIPKVQQVKRQVRMLRHCDNKNTAKAEIDKINATIRGIINYYEVATTVFSFFQKYGHTVKLAAFRALKHLGVRWLQADKTNNLTAVHRNYRMGIPVIEFMGLLIGVTDLNFCKWQKPHFKNQQETPFSSEGRKLYLRRSGKRYKLPRDDLILEQYKQSMLLSNPNLDIYNFEYVLNIAYAFNRDKRCCRVCKLAVDSDTIAFHHINPNLPIDKLNRVPNLATVHKVCHEFIHSETDYRFLGKRIWLKIQNFMERLLPKN